MEGVDALRQGRERAARLREATIEPLLLNDTSRFEAVESLGKRVETVRHLRDRVVARLEAAIELFLLDDAFPLEAHDPLGQCVDARRLGSERLETVRHPFECLVRLCE